MDHGKNGHVILFSAKDVGSLRGKLQNMLTHLDKHQDTDLASLSYQLCTQRVHHGLRLGSTVSFVAELQKFIDSTLDSGFSGISPVTDEGHSVVFTFTGEGSVYTGSPRLFARSRTFRDQILRLDAAVRRHGFDSVVPVIDASASEEYAKHPVTSQLAIVVLEVALAQYWKTVGIHPSAVVGHSLGEYSAMIVSGVLTASDALFLVGRRAQLTIEKCVKDYAMLSVRASVADIATTLQHDFATATVTYEIACRNTHSDTVLGTQVDNIADMSCVLQAAGRKCTKLAMPFAYHTAQMDAIVKDLRALASKTTFMTPTTPYISALLGKAVYDGTIIDADYMKRQTREPVNFAGAIDTAMATGLANERTVWIDIGPHPICAGFVKALVPGSNVLSSCRRKEDAIDTLSKSLVQLHLAGVNPIWSEHLSQCVNGCQEVIRGKLSSSR